MNNAAYNNTNNNTHNHTDNHTMLHWFYSFTAKVRLTGTAQRLWHCLYYRMDGTATGRFCEIASTSLEAELGICRKTLQRARVALAKAGLIRCEVRGKSVYYMLLMPETMNTEAAQDNTQSKNRQTAVRNEVLNLSTSPCLSLLPGKLPDSIKPRKQIFVPAAIMQPPYLPASRIFCLTTNMKSCYRTI